MKVLELFAGTRSISRAFEKNGHKTYSVEWCKDFENISLYADIGKLTVDDVIKLCNGKPDVIWGSPDCTTFSVMAISTHRERERLTAISLPRPIMPGSVTNVTSTFWNSSQNSIPSSGSSRTLWGQ